MPNKTSHIFHRPKVNPLMIALAKTRQFIHDYSLPLLATVFLLLLAAVGVIIGNSGHISTATILSSLDSKGTGYGKLLSNDKTSSLTVEKEGSSTGTARGTASSFSVNTNTSTPPTHGRSSPSPGNTTGPFSAAIASFNQGAVTLECSKPRPMKKWCTKHYAFSSSVRTQNGPGMVKYSWRSTVASATGDGSFSVGGSSALTPLSKALSLPCDTPSSFSLQFVILAPGFTQSAVKIVNHNCNEL